MSGTVHEAAMTVVLLELDPESRRIEMATLRYGGYNVARARSLEQAITQVRARRADAGHRARRRVQQTAVQLPERDQAHAGAVHPVRAEDVTQYLLLSGAAV